MTVSVYADLVSPLGSLSVLAGPVVEAQASLVSPLGSPYIAGVPGTPELVEAQASLPTPLGDSSILAGPVARSKIRASLPSPLGGLAVTAALEALALASLVSPLGSLKATARSLADDWGTAGFPLPRLNGYGYTKDAGIERTPMLSGITRQRRRWDNGQRTATVSFEIPTADLYDMEAWVAEHGYDWFGMRMVTGDNTGLEAEPHTVRIMADPSYGDVYGENITITLSIEVQNSLAPVVCPEPEPEEPACLRMDDQFIIVGEYQDPPPAVDANGCVVELDEYAYLSLTIDEAYLQQQSPTSQGVTTWTLTGSDLHLLTDYENTGITIFGLDPYRVLGSMDTFEEIPPFVVTADAYIGTAYVDIQGPSAYPYLDPEDKTFALCCLRAEE